MASVATIQGGLLDLLLVMESVPAALVFRINVEPHMAEEFTDDVMPLSGG